MSSAAWADDILVPSPVYMQDFESASTEAGAAGSNFGITGATLSGSGAIHPGDPLFGKYYQNMPGATETTKNTNFLTLTTNAFTRMQTEKVKTVTISFWINAFNSSHSTDWGSIFVAYGESGNTNHGYPYGFDIRNTLAVHTNVWRAFYHDNGSQNSSWLSKESTLAASWHHVAVVYTEDRTDENDVKLVIEQYIDGIRKQSFSLTNGWDGVDIGNRKYSLLDDMGRLTEFCIGGNSSETWNDPDNQYAYDDIAFYNVALTAAQINQIRANKLNRTVTGTQIGTKDCGTASLGAMTDKVRLYPGDSYSYSFKNYNNGGTDNYRNFLVPVYNPSDVLVIAVRADNWENMHHVGETWGSNAGCTSDFNWTNWVANMNGATVNMTVSFTAEKKYTMSSTITTVDGSTTWHYSYTNDYTDSPIDLSSYDYIQAALSVENAWLDVLSEDYSAFGVTVPVINWSTFANDYALDFTTPIAGLTPYMVTGHTGNAITLSEVTTTVPAGTPLLLKGTSGTSYSIPVAASSSTDVSSNKLQRGTGTVSYEEGKTKYVLSADGTTPIFKKIVGTSATVPAGKAYLEFNEVISARELTFDFDNETTAISELTNTNLTNYTNEYFNLAGQRVANPTKGLYIVNGKKVVVK